MRRAFSITALLGLGAGLAYVVHDRGLDRMLLGDTRLGAPPSEVATAWKTEEEWLAGEVARDIVEMAFYARHRRAPAPGEATAHAKTTGAPGVAPIRITITTKGTPDATVDLPMEFIWGPGEYVPVARLAAERMGLAVATTDSGNAVESSLVALTEPTLGVLESESQRVSAMLAARPQDPAAHESAALVLAALALREAAGISHEVRPTLSRMTAHLALADFWGHGSQTSDGRVARAALLVLAQRGAEAESTVDALPAATLAEKAWCDALFVRVTDDWRRVTDPRNATLLERMAYVRATMRAGTQESVLEQLTEIARDEADYAELARIAMDDSTALSVEVGNLLPPIGLATEEKGLAQVHQQIHGWGSELSPVKALDAAPGRAITAAGPRVIDWGAWSAYFRRHLLHQLTLDEMHTRNMLALPERANARGRRHDAVYGRVPQYSFLQDRRESHGGTRPTRFAESIDWTIDRPEQVTAFHFFVTEDLAAREVIRRGPAARAKWFDPPLPRGTTFDLRMRQQALRFEPEEGAGEARLAVSPRDPILLAGVVAAHPRGAPIADLEKKLGPRIDYDVTLLGTLASATKDRPQLELLYRRLCAVGPTRCGALGVFLAEEGRDDEAAVAVRKTFDSLSDRVSASWYATWLVRYYVARERTREAAEVAEEAASTGSGSGMRATAALLEHQRNFDAVEKVLLMMRSRYGDDATADPLEQDDDDHLIAFYHRMANERGDAAYAERFTALASRWFPAGLEKLEPAALDVGAASAGVAILQGSYTALRIGLKPGDVIVGVDGYRVRTARQYEVARGFRQGSEMELYVWRHPGFHAIKTRTWNRLLDSDLRTNVPGEPTIRG